MSSRNPLFYLYYRLVNITPTPVFPALEGLNDRVAGAVEMFGGMFVRGRIATANVAADQAEAQVYPAVAAL